ncbi:MAG TPA: asparagine synthase (glutamine-hydrolyzing), partial [Rhodospirillaceae bacterium]|nr:asparagine synthase (glutamine-hydrolyzing) [Rhodospirillaceae bacterium]
LAVVDVPGGAQPMWDASGDICVVFNGEIYNHRGLRRQLEARGCRFRTDHSDTEVLIHGYKIWGMGLWTKLNGMFAVAIYDRHQKKITLARDRFGEKPLFYAPHRDAFVFASELPAMRTHLSLRAASASKLALMKFFAHGFFPAAHTPFDGIYKLPAGHILTVDAVTRSVDTKSYWRLEIIPETEPSHNIDELAEELEALLSRAILKRLESDVPLGVFLSGGLDSSTLLSFAAEARPENKLKTFSMGFSDTSYDESAFSKKVSAHVGSTHYTEVCDLEASKGTVPELLSRLGEPLGDSSVLPTSMLASFARKHVTVALSGDGGDELFAGYDPFRVLERAKVYNQFMPKPAHAAVAMAASHLPLSDRNMSLDFVLNRGLRGLRYAPSLWNPVWLAPLQPEEIADLFAEQVSAEELYSEAIDAWDAVPSTHLVDRVLDFYTRFYLTDGILVKTDRASMMASLETRAPFLDNELVDFVRRLPWQTKLRGNIIKGYSTKWILKRAVRRRLPESIIHRHKKGFGMPLARWLKNWKPPEQESVPFINSEKFLDRWRDHSNGSRDDRLALWNWLSLSQIL